ncbi:rnapii degradation factor def1 [Stemphylium lycopersici]|uniref:RNA polymerase II degradation factor 1 n=1 Tax=Stemphylium lycopersici TaxID=183478 RepID=A0A364NCT0_STELY|nr:rnapii degradation factor def1 [Stemphylium lycopersici]RAR07941.1 rnapii degradation factor def1 [Stemphylium lycopersici]RAR15066.1 rnapii degradation factor def1 [Stemphylium lycopersici]
MSEAPSRPARGRSSARGGRASYGSRGPRKTNGDSASSTIDTSADQGELGELKKRYQSQLPLLKELFPEWTDADLVLAIEESDGDLQTTIEKISEGAVSQFSEVPKKAKDRSRSKAKENVVPTDGTSSLRGRPDGARRGVDSGRGGRGGRGTDRGRGGIRGGRGGAAAGPRTAAGSVPTTESSAWDTPAVAEEPDEAKHDDTTAQAPEATPDAIKPAVEATMTAAKKTWASMFAAPKPAPAPAVPKAAPKPAPAAAPETPSQVPDGTPANDVPQEPPVPAEEVPTPPAAEKTIETPPAVPNDTPKKTPEKGTEVATPDVTLTPSGDQLTQENVEHLPDESHPPPTETAFSTVASSKDIGSAVATPLNGPTHAPIGRPAIGGFQTTALKATTGTPHRSASYQRRLVEQQEAVVMPGNHAVDRAAVQFGSMGLGDGSDPDVDEDREEAETRTQPPQHSPVAQPRASLPPAPRQAPTQAEAQPQEALPTPKPAPGLPPAPQHQPPLQQSPSNPLSHAMQPQGSQSNQPYNQFARYGQPGVQSEASAPPQKPYDPFGQQIPQSNQSQSHAYDYATQQSQAPSQPGAFSSAPDNYPSYLTAEQRAQYQNYYGTYGQPIAQTQQEAGSAQQRTGSAFGSGPTDSAYAQGQMQQSQSRYGDAQNSGHNTPNPAAMAGQGHSAQGQHAQHGHGAGYPYNHPYYGSPYYANYMNQFGGYGQGAAGYGSFGKGMYGQPHHYGMSPQASFDQHSSSPANAGGFGASSLHDRGSAMAGGFGDYGRSASAASQNPSATAGSAGFGAIPDTFSRPGNFHQSSYGQQGGQGLGDDALKPSSDYKSGGPSPSALGAQPGRPGSANQSTPGQGGPQHSQQGYGGYPSHLGNSGYGGLGGLGHQNSGSHQQSGYGNYGGFGGYGGGSYNRGGWGGNYGHN